MTRIESSRFVAVTNSTLRFGPAERQVRADLRQQQLAEQRAVRVEAVQAVVGGGPEPAGVVEPDAVETAAVAGGEHLAA